MKETEKPRPFVAPARESLRGSGKPDAVDEAGVESFPASDPPGWEPLHAGSPREALEQHGDKAPRPTSVAHPCIRDDFISRG